MSNPLCDPYLVLNKVYVGGKFLKQAIADTVVEPLTKGRTVKICYGVLEKDIYLDAIIAHNTAKSPKTTARLVLKIALYMLEFMQKHDYMVVDYAVELMKSLGKSGETGFVNAFLRGYKLPETPTATTARISFETDMPLWLVKRVRRSYKDEAEKILSAASLGISVRFERNAEAYLEREHLITPFKNSYIFKNFVSDDGFFVGDYTFQSVGSVAICGIVGGAERVLDACAAPGGKSVLLAKTSKVVVACDIHKHRVELIKSYARRMGAKNVHATIADSTQFNREFEWNFDKVLCDCPCSGTGVINENPDIKLFRKEEQIKELCALQHDILNNCARYVKKGGSLYYSTCSILPEENDSTVYNFLAENPDFELVIPSSPLEHKVTAFGLQFLPHISMGVGFFIAELKKK